MKQDGSKATFSRRVRACMRVHACACTSAALGWEGAHVRQMFSPLHTAGRAVINQGGRGHRVEVASPPCASSVTRPARMRRHASGRNSNARGADAQRGRAPEKIALREPEGEAVMLRSLHARTRAHSMEESYYPDLLPVMMNPQP